LFSVREESSSDSPPVASLAADGGAPSTGAEDLSDVALAPVAGPEPEARGRVGEGDDHDEREKE
jgi:hypothetical protein